MDWQLVPMGIVGLLNALVMYRHLMDHRNERRWAGFVHDPTHETAIRNGLGHCVFCGAGLGSAQRRG